MHLIANSLCITEDSHKVNDPLERLSPMQYDVEKKNQVFTCVLYLYKVARFPSYTSTKSLLTAYAIFTSLNNLCNDNSSANYLHQGFL